MRLTRPISAVGHAPTVAERPQYSAAALAQVAVVVTTPTPAEGGPGAVIVEVLG